MGECAFGVWFRFSTQALETIVIDIQTVNC